MLFPGFQHVGYAEIASVAAGTSLALLIANYIVNCLPVSVFKNKRLDATVTPTFPVSVVICARNEDDNLREFLPLVLEQDYPDFEVVVVNDCSYDDTENVIDELAKKYPRLRKTTIKEDPYYKHGKKFAMLVGIKSAKNDRIVFTDADCYPSSRQWLEEMAAGFSDQREIVLGYGALKKNKGFLNKLIRFDALMIAIQYLSAGIKGRPYMGVGRNLAYSKRLFFEQKGFSTHYHINSGDDDLFVNQAATSVNTNVCVDGNAITYSPAKSSFKSWRLQKARHLSTAGHYRRGTGLILFNYFSQYLFLASLVALAFSVNTLLLIPILLLVKVVVQTIVLNKSFKKLNERDLLLLAGLLELILLFIYPIFHVSKLLYKPHQWTN